MFKTQKLNPLCKGIKFSYDRTVRYYANIYFHALICLFYQNFSEKVIWILISSCAFILFCTPYTHLRVIRLQIVLYCLLWYLVLCHQGFSDAKNWGVQEVLKTLKHLEAPNFGWEKKLRIAALHIIINCRLK